jgi:hypothetical protein
MADGSCHVPASGGDSWIIFEVAHVDERPIEDGLSDDTRPTRRERVNSLEHFARRRRDAVMVSDQVNEMAVEPIYRCGHAVTQLHQHHCVNNGSGARNQKTVSVEVCVPYGVRPRLGSARSIPEAQIQNVG